MSVCLSLHFLPPSGRPDLPPTTKPHGRGFLSTYSSPIRPPPPPPGEWASQIRVVGLLLSRIWTGIAVLTAVLRGGGDI